MKLQYRILTAMTIALIAIVLVLLIPLSGQAGRVSMQGGHDVAANYTEPAAFIPGSQGDQALPSTLVVAHEGGVLHPPSGGVREASGSASGVGWVTECVDCKRINELTDRSLAMDSNSRPHIVYGGGRLHHVYHDGSTWHYEIADCSLWVGEHAALAMSRDGNDYPHASYYDSANDNLKYAYKDGSGWHNETVDTAGDVGHYTSIALDGNNHAHISYYDVTNSVLKYAYDDGSNWHTEVLTDITEANNVGWSTSIAIDKDNYPHISFHNKTVSIYHAYQDASGWHIERANTGYLGGIHSSIALDDAGYPHISHQDHNLEELKYTYKDSSGWHVETVENTGGVSAYTSIAFDGSGNPHISYKHDDDVELKHAYRDSGGWHTETVTSSTWAQWTSLDIDGSGYPHISYEANGLWYAYKNGSGWHTQKLDYTAAAGQFNSIALDENDSPRFSYREGFDPGTFDLIRYAYRDGGCWSTEVVDKVRSVQGDVTSLALDGNNYPHIGYSWVAIGGRGGPLYAYLDATGWYTETTVDIDEWDWLRHVSLALEPTAPYTTHIVYQTNDYSPSGDEEVFHAYRDVTGWHTEAVDVELGGLSGGRPSLALESAAPYTPHVSYYDDANKVLKHAYKDGAGWHSRTVDSGGETSSIALDENGYPHISYEASEGVRYAYQDATGWYTETADDGGGIYDVGLTTSLALDGSGYPHISYSDYTDVNNWLLKYAHKDATGWHISTVAGGPGEAGLIGQYKSIAVDKGDHAHISYSAVGDLWYAYQAARQFIYLPLVMRQLQ